MKRPGPPAPSTDIYLFGFGGSNAVAHAPGGYVSLHNWRETGFDDLPPSTITHKFTTGCGRTAWAYMKGGSSSDPGTRVRWELLDARRVRLCERCWR